MSSQRIPGAILNKNMQQPLPVKSSSSSSSQKSVVVAPPVTETISRGGPSPLPESVVYTGAQLLKLPFTRTGAPEARSFRVFRAQNAPGDASFQDGDGSSDFGPDELYLGYRKPLGAKKNSFLGGLATMAGVGSDKSADRWTLHPLSSMSWVRLGDSSPNFQRNRAKGGLRGVDTSCCFTVMGPERSLDIICSSSDEAEEWCTGIHAAIRTAKGAKKSSSKSSVGSSSSSNSNNISRSTDTIKSSDGTSHSEEQDVMRNNKSGGVAEASYIKNKELSHSSATSSRNSEKTLSSTSSSSLTVSAEKLSTSAPVIDTALAAAASAPAALQAAFDVSVWDDEARASYFSQALKDAITKKRPDEVLLAFSEGCDPSLCVDEETGDNALTYACAINAPSIVRVCLENSVPFMPWGADGPDALHVAAMSGSEACVVEIMTVAENSPGHVAFILARAEPVTGNTSLHAACAGGFGGVAAALLLKGGLELTAVNNQYRTPLHLASMCKPPSAASGGGVRGSRFRDYVATVQVLIEFGAEATLSWADEQGDTALHLATTAGSPSIVEVLLATLSVNPLIINPITKLSPLQIARNKAKEKSVNGAGKVAASEVLKLLEEYSNMPTVAKQGEIALIGGVQRLDTDTNDLATTTANDNNDDDKNRGYGNVDEYVDEETAALRDAGFTSSGVGGFSAFTVGGSFNFNHYQGDNNEGYRLASIGAAHHLQRSEYNHYEEGRGGASEGASEGDEQQPIQSVGIQVYPWQQLFGVSPDDGQTYPYWWNCETGESSWEAPTHVQAYLNAIRGEAEASTGNDHSLQASSQPSNTTDDPHASKGSESRGGGGEEEEEEKVEDYDVIEVKKSAKLMTTEAVAVAVATMTTSSEPPEALSASSSSSSSSLPSSSSSSSQQIVKPTEVIHETSQRISKASEEIQPTIPQTSESLIVEKLSINNATTLSISSQIDSVNTLSSSATASATVSVTPSVLSAVLSAASSENRSSSSIANISNKSSASFRDDIAATATLAATTAVAPVTAPPAPPQKASIATAPAPTSAPVSVAGPAMTTESFEKYSRMLKMGVPREAVVQKLLKDGATKEDITAFSSYVDSGAAAASIAQTSSSAATTSKTEKSATSTSSSAQDDSDMSLPKRGTAEIQKDALATLQADPKFDKYLKMKKMGVPLGAIKAKLTEEGFSIEDQTLFLSAFASPSVLESMGLQSSSGGGGGANNGAKSNAVGGVTGAETRKLTAPTLKLHWDPLKLDSAAHAKSLWGRLQMQQGGGGGGGGESKSNGEDDELDGADAAVISLESDDLDMLAVMFAAPQNGKGNSSNATTNGKKNGEGVTNGGGGGNGDSSGGGGGGEAVVTNSSLSTGPPISLLDGKRASNVNIVLAQFRRFPSFLSIATAVYKRDSQLLPKDMLEKLSSVLPTADEAAMFKKELPRLKASGEEGRLVEADKWFAFVSTVPRFSSIVAAALTVTIFDQQSSDLVERAKILSQACAQVTRSTRLQSVMSCVLSIGNALNAGHASLAGATAISLDSLLKLTSTRAADKKTSLMDALVMLCERKALKQVAASSNGSGNGGAVKPEMHTAALNPITVDERRQSMLAWTDDVIGLQNAARVDVNELRSDSAKLKAAVTVVKNEIAAEEKRIAEEEEEVKAKDERERIVGESKTDENGGETLSSTSSSSNAIDPRQAMLNQLLKGRGAGGGGGGGVKSTKGSNTALPPHPISIDDRRRFIASLFKFANEASAKLSSVDEEVAKATASAADLAVYFGEPSTIGVSKVFSVLTEFAGGFNGSLSALRRKRASESKSEAKNTAKTPNAKSDESNGTVGGMNIATSSSSNNPPPLPKGPPPMIGGKGSLPPNGRPPMIIKK